MDAQLKHSGMTYMQKITPVVEEHYKLILWMLPKIANFPKDQRFLLADRIEKILFFELLQ